MLNWLWRRRAHWWVWAPASFAATLLFLAIVSWLFSIPAEICPDGASSGDDQCKSYNLALGVIWKIIKTLDASSVFLTAIATAGLVAVTYLLVKLGKEQGRTSRAQLRPYVFISKIGFTRDEDNVLLLKFAAKNYGKATPAFRVSIHGHGVVSIYERYWLYPIVGEALGDTTASLGPDTEASFNAKMPGVMTDTLWAGFLAGKQNLHVWGVIKYQDIFGEPYETEYRMINRGGPDYIKNGFQQSGSPRAT
jgi:hypothetical protein